jgi:hypothetical protein
MSNKQFEWTDATVLEFMGVKGLVTIEEFKKDWEKRNQPIPEYEILSFDGSKFSEEQVRAAAKFGEYDPNGIYVAYALQHNFPIHSVRRLSDGEVFTVGDRVCYKPKPEVKWEIDNFRLRADGKLVARSKNDEMVEFVDDDLQISPLKTPLFTTEDGVDIYKGTTFYEVSTERWDVLAESEPHKPPYDQYYKYFSNKYNAERYVLLNKPVLTMKEVLDAYPVNTGEYCDFVERLTTLAKAKL